jgi:hypothetical protein
VAGFWLTARSKWETLIAVKFWLGCTFFFFHHETLTINYPYLPHLMVTLVQKLFFFLS